MFESLGRGCCSVNPLTNKLLCPYLDDLQHLHSCDLAIPVQVIHVEGPVELLLEAAPGGDGQGTDELSEVDGPVSVLVEGPEGVLGKLGGVSVGEKLRTEDERDIASLRNKYSPCLKVVSR